MFKTDNKTIAKIRRLIGFADMERAFAKADMIHAMTVEAISEEIDRIEKEEVALRPLQTTQSCSCSLWPDRCQSLRRGR